MRWWASTRRPPLVSVFDLSVVRKLAGQTILKASGKDAARFFEGEAGGHRWQRIPPTEKRGRVQTSTVTVAVLEAPGAIEVDLKASDLSLSFFGAGGPGGQHQNKTASACRITHAPTGITVVSRESRHQHANRRKATERLQERIETEVRSKQQKKNRKERREQIGKGVRAEKIRTYRERDDRVVDHVTGRRTSLSKLRKGDWSDLKS